MCQNNPISPCFIPPFGSGIKERAIGLYRYGFNGEEKMEELAGEGMSYDLGARFYDARLGKMFSIDPLASNYPWQSVYAYCYNNPIWIVDVKGMGGDPIKHSVKKGESLWGGSKKFYNNNKESIGTSWSSYWNSVQAWNKGGDYGKIGGNMYLSDPKNNDEVAIFEKPSITPRADWNARNPILEPCGEEKRSYELNLTIEQGTTLAELYNTVVIHHTGNTNSPTINQIQDKHMFDNCKADIGYHFAIDLNGKIYEGRPLIYKGAHVINANTGMIGVAILGDFSSGPWYDFNGENKPTLAMGLALYSLVGWLNQTYGLENGIAGHGDINCGHTLCSGDLLQSYLNWLRTELKLNKPKCVNNEGAID
jgi:RHS repeat-associated protein